MDQSPGSAGVVILAGCPVAPGISYRCLVSYQCVHDHSQGGSLYDPPGKELSIGDLVLVVGN